MAEDKNFLQQNLLNRLMKRSYFIGIDVGSQGARVVLLDDLGMQVASKEEQFELTNQSREEQSPLAWWSSCLRSLEMVCNEVRSVIDLSALKAMAVTSTSGTIIPMDKNNQPLHHALMYSDPRSAPEAEICNAAAKQSISEGNPAFNASSGLPKMSWFLNHYPQQIEEIGRFIHAADYITGKLSGNFSITDYTNALKSGYDPQQLQWPGYISSGLAIRPDWLQQVVPPGEPIGYLEPSLSAKLKLPTGIIITAGMTDGCASQVASGAVRPGDWNTTIGTTMVIKGVTKNRVPDPTGALYCHRHPEGYWMPGGASNTGADWVSKSFSQQNLDRLNEAAASLLPTGELSWPLLQQGERFPFLSAEARGFAPEGLKGEALFAANMEGVAYIERYAYERIKWLSGEEIKQVFTAGGASNSDTWLWIRANVLNLKLCKMNSVSGAAGAAVLAASKTVFVNITEAASLMVRLEKLVQPDVHLAAQYEKNYHRFIQQLKQRGYITA